ncbi:MAG: protein kinase [Edaphobacter sp.]
MVELRSLLAACEAEELLAAQATLSASAASSTSSRHLGPYEIDSLLGRGGMGAVYLAHRVDGQFRQQAAIKVIDLPLATDLFRERFRQERQILASLNHPYIARLLDGGVSDSGELYLVMEFVDGVSISDFCETRKLSIAARLQLMQRVCDAVQFAHRNLIVHRDLKPDNILVCDDGSPRLLDFGTAKLLTPLPSDMLAGLTQNGLQSFTPQYASPEQVLGEPITTASDIYSLGVILYLLLADVLPYHLKDFSTSEMLRVICNEQPPKPSTHAPQLGADLDAIVLKALRKEPHERYGTVKELSDDLGAYLAGRPVAARQGNFQYQAAKFIRRNLLAAVVTSLLCLSVLLGIAGVLWQSHTANLQRRRAEARSADLRELSNSLLSELDRTLKDIPGSAGAQKLLITRVIEHLDHMALDAQGDRQTELDLIAAYTRLGDVQGNVYEQNEADPVSSLTSYNRALALALPLADRYPGDMDALGALATVLETRGESLSAWAPPQQAADSLKSAVDIFDRMLALPGATPRMFQEASAANQTLGDVQCEDEGLADIAAGIASYKKSLGLDESALRIDPSYLPARRGLAYMHLDLGNVQLEDNPSVALAEFTTARSLLDALPAVEKAKLPLVRLHSLLLRKQAVALSNLGDYAGATAHFDQSRPVFQRLADADPTDVRPLGDLKRQLADEAASLQYAANPTLANVPTDRQRNLMKAAQLLQLEADLLRRLVVLDPTNREWKPELAGVEVSLGSSRYALHPTEEDAALIRENLTTLKNFAKSKDATLLRLELTIDALLAANPPSLRDPSLTVDLAERAVTLTHRRSVPALEQLAQAYHANGQRVQAIAAANEGLALLPPATTGHPESRLKELLTSESQP